MGYSFDGPNKKIQLTAGTTGVELGDLYSRWIDWFLTADNSKFLPAFRNVGGDPISAIKSMGVTYFLTNGWRIVPQSADHRLTINGNLVTDPSGFSPVDTVAGYSIVVEYSVSNLVDAVGTEPMDQIAEGDKTFADLLRGMAAVLFGKSGGGGTATITFRDVGDSQDRIVATVDANGNRTDVAVDLA